MALRSNAFINSMWKNIYRSWSLVDRIKYYLVLHSPLPHLKKRKRWFNFVKDICLWRVYHRRQCSGSLRGWVRGQFSPLLTFTVVNQPAHSENVHQLFSFECYAVWTVLNCNHIRDGCEGKASLLGRYRLPYFIYLGYYKVAYKFSFLGCLEVA